MKGEEGQSINTDYGSGLLCVVSSPSGGGKTSIIEEVRKRHPEFDYSVSATTRPKRPGEVHGVDYLFVSDKQFDAYLQVGSFVEWAGVHDCRYGTLKEPILRMLEAGKVVMLDLDVHGGMNVKREFPEKSLLIFLCPPSENELVNRLQKRNSESEQEIERRLERMQMELSYVDRYDVQIVNRDFGQSVRQVERAIQECQARLEV